MRGSNTMSAVTERPGTTAAIASQNIVRNVEPSVTGPGSPSHAPPGGYRPPASRGSMRGGMFRQERMDALRDLPADPLDGGNLLDGRGPNVADGAESADQRLLPALPDARDLVEDREDDPAFPQRLMVGVGEPVRLVPQPLQQLQPLGIPRKRVRFRQIGHVDQLLLLRERDHRNRLVVFEQDLARGGELAAPAVEHDQVRKRRPLHGYRLVTVEPLLFLPRLREPALQHLTHHRDVVGPVRVLHPEPAIVALLRPTPFRDDERGDRFAALKVADIVAFDPHRRRVETEQAGQLPSARADLVAPPGALLGEVQGGVLPGHRDEAHPIPALRLGNGHATAPPFAEPPLDDLAVRDRLGDEDFRGGRRGYLVELAHECGQRLRRRHAPRALEHHVLLADEPPPPNEEDLHTSFVSVLGEREDVSILGAGGDDPLLLAEGLDPAELIPQLRGAFEIEPLRGGLHLSPQAVEQTLLFALEELPGLADLLSVLF